MHGGRARARVAVFKFFNHLPPGCNCGSDLGSESFAGIARDVNRVTVTPLRTDNNNPTFE
jgi:hypothetical protein